MAVHLIAAVSGHFIEFISQLPRVRCLTLSIKLGRDDRGILEGLNHMLQVLTDFFVSSVLTSSLAGVIIQLVTAAPGRLNQALSAPEAILLCSELEEQLLRIPIQHMTLSLRSARVNREDFWVGELGRIFPKLHRGDLLTCRADPGRHNEGNMRYNQLTMNCLLVTSIGHNDIVSTFSISPDGKWVATGSPDTTIILWELDCRRVAHQWIAHSGEITCLAFSPYNEKLASGGRDHQLMVWNLGEEESVERLAKIGRAHV